MDYLNTIQCKKEPFAATPGTDLFLSQPIRDAFEKLTHSIRLGAGLHIIAGSAGTGKSTILQQLSDKFRQDKDTVVLSINNPQFSNLQQFLTTLAGVFKTIKPPSSMGDKKLQEAFNSFFYKQCLQEKKTLLLLIDNGHTLPDFCIEALDAIYDHHADCRRLLQTVISGETSLQQKIKSVKNISNRVVFTVPLKPFSFKETKELIRFHLEQAAANPNAPPSLFSGPSQWAIYRLSQGHPKQIIDLCHLIVLTLIIENRKKADWFMTLRCANLLNPKRAKKLQLIRAGSLSSLFVLMLVFGLGSEQLKTIMGPGIHQPVPPPVAIKVEAPSPTPQEKVKVEPEPVQQEMPKETVSSEQTIEKEIETPQPVEDQIAAVPPIAEAEAEKTELTEMPAQEEIPVETITVVPEPEPVQEIAKIVTPAILERRDVKPGDTFLVMIQKVYGPGHLKPHYINQVVAANPQLKDPDNLSVGDEVFFPVLSAMEETTVAAAAPKKSSPLVSKKLDRELQAVDSPDLIGKLSVQPGDTLGLLIRGIYGPFSFNPDYTAKVLAVNRHLKNPDSLEVGETVYFPDLPITPETGLPAKPSLVSSRGDIPEFLGEIIAIEDETFGDMIRRIYGPYSLNDSNIKKVMAVNPDLKNPNALSVGQKIRFPAILVALTPKAPEVWWVRIVSLDNLQSAYRFLRVYSKWSPPMLIIPSRNDKGQLLFSVLLQNYFTDEQSAQAAIDELPASITADAKTLHGLNPNTFYYWTKQKD